MRCFLRDLVRVAFVVIACLAMAGRGSAQTWRQMYPTDQPTARSGAAFVYDGSRGVLFGGHNTSANAAYDETWLWNGTDWSLAQHTPGAPKPGARHYHAMAHDAFRGRLVLFGGFGDYNSPYWLDDTWEFDGTDWQMVASGSPPPLAYPSVAYDSSPSRRKTVLTGFYGTTFQVWEWDGATWTQVAAPSPAPSTADTPRVVYDASRARTVLLTLATTASYTHEWDGTQWRIANDPNIQFPTPRTYYALAYDSANRRVTMFGGLHTFLNTLMSTVQMRTGAAWAGSLSTASMSRVPAPRRDAAMIYDSARDEYVIFGGYDGGDLGDTWTLVNPGRTASGNWTANVVQASILIRDAIALGSPATEIAVADSGATIADICASPLAPPCQRSSAMVFSIPQALAYGEVTGDGLGDLVGVEPSTDTITIAPRDFLTGKFLSATRTLIPLVRPVDVLAVDLDSNSIDEVVVAGEGDPLSGGGGVAVFYNGQLTGAPALPASNGSFVRLAAGDINLDGDLEVVALRRGSPDRIYVFDNVGPGTLGPPKQLDLPCSGLASAMCLDEIDNDGFLDILVVVPQLFPALTQDLHVFFHTRDTNLNNSYGSSYVVPPIYLPGWGGVYATEIVAGSFDLNVRKDLAVVDPGAGTVTVLYNFGPQPPFNLLGFAGFDRPKYGVGPVGLFAGDLNADGIDDLLVANGGSDDLTVNIAYAAVATPYGGGCPGTLQRIPASGSSNLPRVNTTFGVTVANARNTSPALLLFSTAYGTTQLSGGCDVLVDTTNLVTLLTYTNGLGASTFNVRIPNTQSLIGLDGFFQWAVFDPQGAFANVLSFSDGLQIQVGN